MPDGTIYAAMEEQVRRALSGKDTLSRTLGYLRTEVVRPVGPDVPANAAAYALMEREEQRRQKHQQPSQQSASQGSPAQVRAEPPADHHAPNAYARAKDPG